MIADGIAPARRARAVAGPRFVRDLVGYALVSLVALGCDYGCLLVLVALGAHYLVATALSFSLGMVVAYALSVRFVFPARRVLSREREATAFFAIGIAGLVLTQGLVWLLVAHLDVPVALAKIPTTAVVFAFNFLCRRGLVFAAPRDAVTV